MAVYGVSVYGVGLYGDAPEVGSGVTFLDLQDEVLNHGFPVLRRPRVKNWLNEAQAEIVRVVKVPNLLTAAAVMTTAGQPTVTLPTDAVRIIRVTYDDGSGSVSYEPSAGRLLGSVERGMPEAYTQGNGAALLLSPTPDRAYAMTVTYYKAPPALVNDGDVPALPADYHNLMVSYALMRAFRAERQFNEAQACGADYLAGLRRMQADQQFQVADGPKQVPGTWSDF